MKYPYLMPDRSLLKQTFTGFFLLLTLLFSVLGRAQDLIVPQDLVNEINQSYVARAIIGLKVETQPEGNLNGAAVSEQRGSIAETQDQFLSDLTQSVWGSLNGIGNDTNDTPKLEAKVKFETIPYLVMEVDGWMLSKIKENSAVANIQLDEMIPLSLAQSIPLIGADKVWAKGRSGSGYAVAVLDTGVDKNHSMLSGKVIAEACFSTKSSLTQTVCPNGNNSQIGTGAGVPCSSSLSGCDHGTHVAGIVAGNGSLKGVAKDGKIIAVQVFSRYGSRVTAWNSDIIRGLEHVLSLHKSGTKIASANMSLGTSAVYGTCDSAQSAIKAAIDNLRSVGIPTIIASGNSSRSNGLSSPACISSAISVGATAKNDAVASYSNSASILKLLAPGSSIVSSVLGGSTSSKNGTSMAAPHVAGAFAVLKAASPTSTINEILSCLESTGKAIRDGRNSVTKPRIQLDEALACLLPEPDIEASPNSLNFGSVNVDSSSAPKVITITNSGNADLNIGTMSITSTEFILQSNNCASKTVAPTKACTFQVVFKPTSAGTKASNVTIASNDPDTANLSIAVTGIGVASCKVTSSAGTGGSIVPVGVKTLACGSSQSYSITPSSGYKILDVKVDNSSVGAVTSRSLRCDCPNGKNVNKTISASFAALAPNIVVNPTSANFGEVALNFASPVKSFTISNTGDANLQLGKLSVSNTEFILTDSCSNKAIAPKGACTVSITFKPLSEGNRTGNLAIPSNDADTSTLNVPLQGIGKKGVPVIETSPTAINFGDVQVGNSSSTRTITVTNKGTAVMYVAGIVLEGTHKADFTIVSNNCSYKQIIPSNSCTVQLQFKPGTQGNKTAQLKVVSPNAGNKVISLTGTSTSVAEACSAKPTITSKRTGSWNDRSVWDGNRIPNSNDIVLIKEGHNVTLPYYRSWAYVNGLCNHGNLWSGTYYWYSRYRYWRWGWNWRYYYYYSSYSRVYARSFIDNYGQIRGVNSISRFPWWWRNRGAGYLYLYTPGEFKNYPKALVKGGDGITRGSYGTSGGRVYVYAGKLHNYGTYGTSSYGSILGGNGAYGRRGGGHGGWVYTTAYNGYLKNGGLICGGNGADFNGRGGSASVHGKPYTLLNGGRVCTGRHGRRLRIDPDVISLAGKDTQIEGTDVAIYGGKDFVIDLSDMSEGAISAETLTLAVGEGGMVDLRGSNAKVLKVTGELKIFSDNILLDEGVNIEDVIQAEKITIAPAKIMYEMTVESPQMLAGKTGETLPIKLVVTNTGPATDSYTVSIANSKGWVIDGLTESVTVEPQQIGEVDLNVNLPAEEGENTLVVTITSQADNTVSESVEILVHSASELMELIVNDEGEVDTSIITDDLSQGEDTSNIDENGELIGIQPVGDYNVSGSIKDKAGEPLAGATVKAGEQTTVTDDAGNWSIGGLDEGNYTVTATKEGYTFKSVDVSLEGDETSLTVTIEVLSQIVSGEATISGTVKDQGKQPISGVSITIGDKETTTDANGTFSISGFAEGNYTVVATKAGYTFPSKECEVGTDQDCEVQIKAGSLLSLDIKTNPRRPNQGENVTYTVTISNQGTETATGIILDMPLPEGTALVSVEADAGVDCQLPQCTLAELAAGASVSISMVIDSQAATRLTNTISLQSNEYPAESIAQRLSAIPYFSVEKASNTQTITKGDSVSLVYKVAVNANAPEAAQNVQFKTELARGYTLLDTSEANCDTGNLPELICDMGDMAVGDSREVKLDLRLDDFYALLASHRVVVKAANYTADGAAIMTKVYLGDAVVDIIVAIDVTGSMHDEITALEAVITKLKTALANSADTQPMMAVVSFRDDIYLEIATTHLEEVEKAVEKMEAKGGGACPEASYEAMMLAVKHAKQGGTLILVTDAPPYADADMNQLITAINDKNLEFVLIQPETMCSPLDEWQFQ